MYKFGGLSVESITDGYLVEVSKRYYLGKDQIIQKYFCKEKSDIVNLLIKELELKGMAYNENLTDNT